MADSASTCEHANRLPFTNTIGDVFRRYGEDYISAYRPSREEITLLTHIRKCRTPYLGGVVIKCDDCDSRRKIYKSCGHSRCPVCQSCKRLQMQDRISKRLLKVPYVHMIFTVPHQLNSLFKANQQMLYSLLYRSSWKALKLCSAKSSNLGALPGMISVMHSWGSRMNYHVHLHALVTFGGVDDAGNWHYPKRKNKLIPYREINQIYGDLFMKEIDRLLAKGQLQITDTMLSCLEEVRGKRWVVHSTQPQLDTKVLEEYLSRYIFKIAVSNSRLSFDDASNQVQLIYNDYRNQLEGEAAPKKVRSFEPLSFIHQFLQHLPPKSFQRTRYYGLHAGRTYHRLKNKLSKTVQRVGKTVRTLVQILRELIGEEGLVCEACGSYDLVRLGLPADSNWLSKHVPGFQLRAPPAGRHKRQKVGKRQRLANGGAAPGRSKKVHPRRLFANSKLTKHHS